MSGGGTRPEPLQHLRSFLSFLKRMVLSDHLPVVDPLTASCWSHESQWVQFHKEGGKWTNKKTERYNLFAHSPPFVFFSFFQEPNIFTRCPFPRRFFPQLTGSALHLLLSVSVLLSKLPNSRRLNLFNSMLLRKVTFRVASLFR